MKRIVLFGFLFACIALFAVGCSQGGSNQVSASSVGFDDSDATDQLYSDDVYGAVLDVFQFDGDSYTVDKCDSVDIYADEPLKDGGFYEVVADVTYLNGGVAGYVDYPQVKQVSSCEEVSPFELGLPLITEKIDGLTLIGDYADGDVFFTSWKGSAVWTDGEWTWRYEKEITLDDGTRVHVSDGVEEADVKAGIEKGVMSCEDYFVLPPNWSKIK